jgi:hypothetical protein
MFIEVMRLLLASTKVMGRAQTEACATPSFASSAAPAAS